MNFFNELHKILTTPQPNDKIVLFHNFYKSYQNNLVKFDHNLVSEVFEKASYSSFCRIVPARDVPKRKNLTTKDGKIALLHAVAHIEYSAIDLALDAAYRFKNMPQIFYDDWLKVADDEVKHFLMIDRLLNELGSNYGDLEVHDALFEASQNTLTLLERMAVVPRYFEANGLDSTPAILVKLKNIDDEFIKKIVTALELILEEEVDHVIKGDRWFTYACDIEKKDKNIYFDIIKNYYPNGFPARKDINIDARIKAGFSCNELNRIADKEICISKEKYV
jgi:uncharacterized ferritin-like protein (DUF455 family)